MFIETTFIEHLKLYYFSAHYCVLDNMKNIQIMFLSYALSI